MNNNNNNSIPWVEKYRPDTFETIVLDPFNRRIMDNIIKTNRFPNLLLYGPPGTGKTTTIINIINKFQEKYNELHKSLVIHLNASDERGIDIIRNQIRQFVDSDTLFYNGLKFVILDEVDYMTKHAQQSLKYLLQGQNNNVRFCLICNYISRIDESLQNKFMRLRFNQLPKQDILAFLKKICKNENIFIDDSKLLFIQHLYKSDIRSMINYLQANKDIILHINILNNEIWRELIGILSIKNNHKNIITYLTGMSKTYNIDVKHIIKDFLNYILHLCTIKALPPTLPPTFIGDKDNNFCPHEICAHEICPHEICAHEICPHEICEGVQEKSDYLNKPFLAFVENLMHLQNINTHYFKNYVALSLNKLFAK